MSTCRQLGEDRSERGERGEGWCKEKVRQELGEGLLWNLAHKSHVTGGLSVTSTVVVHCVAYLALTDRAEGAE